MRQSAWNVGRDGLELHFAETKRLSSTSGGRRLLAWDGDKGFHYVHRGRVAGPLSSGARQFVDERVFV